MAGVPITNPPPYTATADAGCNSRVTSSHLADAQQTHPQSQLPLYSELFPTTRHPQPFPVVDDQRRPVPLFDSASSPCQSTQTINAAFEIFDERKAAPRMPYCGMVVLALTVLLFCNILFGLIALYLAVVAEVSKDVDAKASRKYGTASVSLSVVGIVLTVTIIVVTVAVRKSPHTSSSATTSHYRHYVSVGPTDSPASPGAQSTPGGRYVSPDTCCRSRGYVYPGNGSRCYDSVVSVDSTLATSANCPYFYHATVCYRNSYVMSAILCCSSDEQTYSLDAFYCH